MLIARAFAGHRGGARSEVFAFEPSACGRASRRGYLFTATVKAAP